MLLVAPLGMATGHPHRAGDGLCGPLHETGRGPHTTACTHMVEDIRRGGLWQLGIAQGGVASREALLSARATAQQAETVVSRDLAHGEMGRTRATK